MKNFKNVNDSAKGYILFLCYCSGTNEKTQKNLPLKGAKSQKVPRIKFQTPNSKFRIFIVYL